MAKWLKRIFTVVGGLVLVLVLAIVALPFVIDPNDYKDELQTLATRQGVHLTLGGPISWQFFPTLGLTVNEVGVAPVTDAERDLAQAQTMTAAVAVMPLLKKQIRVNELRVAGAKIQLTVDNQGRGNWEAFTENNELDSAPTTDSATQATNLDLNIARIRFSNAELNYDDQQSGQRATLRDFDLTITDVNTQQRPFPLELALIAETSALTQPLRMALSSQLAVNNSLDQFAISQGTLRLPDAGIAVGLNTKASMVDTPQFDGELTADITSLQKLFSVLGIEQPTTADPAVLSRLAFSMTFNGDDRQLNVPQLTLTLDDTTVNGDAAIQFPTEQTNLALNVNLQGDNINIDRYLPPTTEDSPTSETTTSEDAPLPLDALRGTDAALTFQFEEVIVNNLPITQLDLAVNGQQGLWQLQKFNANFYQGQLVTTGQLDARNPQATAKVNAALNAVALKPLLMDLADVDALRGTVSVDIDANTRAATTTQLMDNLVAIATFNGDSLIVDGINVEQKYCDVVTQVDPDSESSETVNWPQETTINELSGRLTVDDSMASIEQFTAQVAYLALGVKGTLNLKQQDYAISLPLTLTRNRTSEQGCLVASDFLLNREINVLGCDGNLAELAPAKQCGLRTRAITDLAQQALRYNANKRIEKEVTPKVEEKKEELEEKKDEAKERVRDRLKELLDR